MKKLHYSGKFVNNSSLHFGCFLDGQLHGVMSFGSPLDKSKVLGLVKGTKWNEMLELNRMAFDDYLPKNSESRAISIALKMLRKQASHIKFVLSFADGGQCGDGTIYRASGFVLTGLSKCSIFENDKGQKIQQASISARGTKANKEALRIQYQNEGKQGLVEGYLLANKMQRIDGHSIRYIYLIDKTCQLTCPILPYSKIDEMGAGMYKGQRISIAERRKQAAADGSGSGVQSETGGLTPTLPLHIDEVPNGNQD